MAGITAEAGVGDRRSEAVGAAFQRMLQSLGQMQQAMNVRSQEMMQKVLEAVHIQDVQVQELVHFLQKAVQETTQLQDQRLGSIEASIDALESERAGEVRKLEERMQKLEERMVKLAQRPPLIVGRDRRTATGGPERLTQREDHAEKLNASVQETLNSLSERVKALETQMQEEALPAEFPSVLRDSHPSSSPKNAYSLDASFENLVKFPTYSVGSCVRAPASSDLYSCHANSTYASFDSPSFLTCSSSDQHANVECLGNRVRPAAKFGMEEEMLKLLESGTMNVNVSDRKRNTALHKAASAGLSKCISLILARCVDINAKNGNEDTALHVAVKSLQTDTVSLLVKKGCDVNIRNREGSTPLHIAACVDRNGQCLSTLIQAGARFDLKNIHGATPLHLASSTSNIVAVQLLLKIGASKNVRNNCGKTPYDVAENAIQHLLRSGSGIKKKHLA